MNFRKRHKHQKADKQAGGDNVSMLVKKSLSLVIYKIRNCHVIFLTFTILNHGFD